MVKALEGEAKKNDKIEHKQYLAAAKMHGKMRNNYQILEEIGNGEYGEVFKCQYQESMYENKVCDNTHIRAVKINTKSFMTDQMVKQFNNEVSIHYQLTEMYSHPSILKMYHYYEDSKRYLLVTDICDGGTLENLYR